MPFSTELLEALRALIQQGCQKALRAVDMVQVQNRLEIGHHIVALEQDGEAQAAYGEKLISQIPDALRRKWCWTHYRLLLRVSYPKAPQWYVRMYDDLKRGPDDNPMVEILLGDQKGQSVARYSVLKDTEQILATMYRLVLPFYEDLRAEIARDRAAIEDASCLDGDSLEMDA